MALPLPQFVVLKSKSNGKYLRYVKEHGKAYLRFCGEDVFSLDVKFEIQYNKPHVPAEYKGSSQQGSSRQGPSRHGSSKHGQANEAEFVHIRCYYNNKYLVQVADKRIVPEAQKPETDKSKPSSTLFEPIITGANTKTFQFRHVQRQRLLSINMDTDTSSADPTKLPIECVVINLDSLLKLPKRVLFKDDRGHYLRSYKIKDHLCMQFAKDGDKGRRTVMNEVLVTGDGYVRIKSRGHGKFWRCDPTTNLIWADSDGDPSDDVLFWPVKLEDNTIALRNKRNNSFCRRVTNDQLDGELKDCLCVTGHGITKEAHFVVKEPFTSRKIEIVEFRLEHARTDVIERMPVITKKVTNQSKTDFVTEQLMLSCKLDESFSWSSSIGSMLGFKATVVTAGIPKVVNGKIRISSEVSKLIESVQWGKTVTKSVPFQSTKPVNVKPRTTLIMDVHATKVSYQVPFSYIQSDTLPSGDVVSDRMEDGVYSIVTWSYSNYDMKEELLDKTP